MIRKITRGTGTATIDGVTISCSITDTSKVIVLLDSDLTIADFTNSYNANGGHGSSAGGSVYLKSVSNSGIVVVGAGLKYSGSRGSYYATKTSITFSYQIIEFI